MVRSQATWMLRGKLYYQDLVLSTLAANVPSECPGSRSSLVPAPSLFKVASG